MAYPHLPTAIRAILDGVRHIGYVAGLPPVGALRLGAPWWDRAYSNGTNDRYARDGGEAHRLAVTAGLALHDRQWPSVLDLGCGTGQLLPHVRRFPVRSYTGVDFSAAALDVARNAPAQDVAVPGAAGSALTTVSWVHADLDTWHPTEPADVLMMSEVLYYLARPADVLHRLFNALRPGGVAVFSMWEDGRRWRQWRTITRCAREHDASSTADVRVRKGRLTWRICRFDVAMSSSGVPLVP